jgi:Zn finger protein HypA/HybF involved in hydrogenase expression
MDIERILFLQASLGRTQTGRDIIPEAAKQLSEVQGVPFVKCDNCGLVASKQMFHSGCINCNAKNVTVI